MGDYCGVVSCTQSRAKANKFISFHSITAIKDEAWKKQLINCLGRDFDKEKGMPKKLCICSRHFDEECITGGKFYKISKASNFEIHVSPCRQEKTASP